MNLTKYMIGISPTAVCCVLVLTALGQTPPSNNARELEPNQTIEREMTGAETHRYKIALQPSEFFQVRVEQKDVDVALKLSDASGSVLASMDSPNGEEGPETLSFVASVAGNYTLEVSGFDPKAEKGKYTIRRQASRTATAGDRRRVEVQRLFVAGMTARDTQGQAETAIRKLSEAQAGWRELADSYMAELTARQVKQIRQSKAEAASAETVALLKEGTVEGLRKALARFQKAQQLYRETEDKQGEALSLVGMGKVYSDLGENDKALTCYDQALPLVRAVGDLRLEVTLLNNLAVVYQILGENLKALEYFGQALSITRSIGDKRSEAATLSNIGAIYSLLGEYQRALEYHNRALPIRLNVADRIGEGHTLNDIGNVYADLGDTHKAVEYYNQALSLRRVIGDKVGEPETLNNLCSVYGDLGDPRRAIEFCNQALQLARDIGDTNGEATTLNNIGALLSDLGNHRKALEAYNKALLLLIAVGDKSTETVALLNLEQTWNLLGNRRLAIFFGKQSVNKLQGLRGAVQGLDHETQKAFLRSVQSRYQRLGELLIQQGQLEQAIHVLNLYQDQQFFDFDRAGNPAVQQAVLSSREQEFSQRYKNTTNKIAQIRIQLEELKRQIVDSQPTEKATKQISKLEVELKTETDVFLTFLNDAEREFGKSPDEKDKVLTMSDVADMQTVLNELSTATKQNTATLYTLIGVDAFHIILMTRDGKVKEFNSPIKAGDLNKKILQFYAILQSPRYDPRPRGKELYDIIFKPVEAELRKADVQTLMWQLDGGLRYVPMAALWDGEKYLVERYQNVVFTRANRERLMLNASSNWTGTGFGNSQAHMVDLLKDGNQTKFPVLPGVMSELQTIFGLNGNDTGIFKGEVFSDANFNRLTFYDAMKKHRPLVHVSSHFAFRPGDDSRSFLLLGDGTALTLNELKKQTRLFEGVELLTLSACNTAATRPDANGREIDGFAELAQRLGAAAVMASLWSVADESTSLLMSGFYRLRKENPQLTKAAVLQLAQVEMLQGKLQPLTTAGNKRDTSDVAGSEINVPRFGYDLKRPYAHPYYWSPFVLIGNWR